MNPSLIDHRLDRLEAVVGKHEGVYGALEQRIRVLEIAHAKLVAYAAGGAFVGGGLIQLFQIIFK